MKPPLLTIAQVCDRLQLGDTAVRRLIRTGKLRAGRVNDTPRSPWRIDPRDLDAYEERQRALAHGPTIAASVERAFDADDALGLTERRF